MADKHPDISAHNAEVIERFRANGRRLDDEGMPIVLLTHRGRRSGKTYVNPLVATGDGDDVIIAATMGGLPKNPQWCLNIVDEPEVTVEWDGQRYPAIAEVIEDDPERARLVELLTVVFPKLPRYEERAAAHRTIPIVRLGRADRAGASS